MAVGTDDPCHLAQMVRALGAEVDTAINRMPSDRAKASRPVTARSVGSGRGSEAGPVALPAAPERYCPVVIDINGALLGAEAARRLRQADCCVIEPGLSDDEFERIEAEYGFRFSADHRAFLAAGLPVSSPPEEGNTWDKPWPDWRSGSPDDLRSHLAWPADGVLLAVQHGYWHASWGTRPAESENARAIAENHMATVPQLAPLYAHRFLPAGGTHGHPVLSVWGTDVIYYGEDLAEYISHEFEEGHEHSEDWNPQADVAFWQDLVQ
ncbi:hypothetical protein [Streptomyces syringium]|uniref:hypothetical protein n=1 Tax=Streptomyces syringium TaxID=76729 RepID=UPI003452724B